MWSLVSLFVWIDGLLSAETFGGPFYNQNRRPRATTKCLPLSEEEGEGNTHQQPRNIIIAPPSAVIPCPPFSPLLLPFPGGRDSGWKGKKEQGHCIDGGEPVLEAGGDAWVVAMPIPPPFFFVFMICTRHLLPLPSFLWKRAGGALVLSLPFFSHGLVLLGGGWMGHFLWLFASD